MGTMYFGGIDASTKTSEIHITTQLDDRIATPEHPAGIKIIVGKKGTGKTEIALQQLGDFAGQKLFLSEKPDGNPNFAVGLDVLEMEQYRSVLKVQILQNFLLTLSGGDDSLAGFFKEYASNWGVKLAEATKGYHKLDLAPFFKTLTSENSGKLWQDTVEAVAEKLGARSALIVLDDLEARFAGVELNHKYAEGLFRAVLDICDETRFNVTCLAFAKTGVWQSVYDAQIEYDKIESHLDHLSWDFDYCVSILAGRIMSIHKIDGPIPGNFDDAWNMLKKEFGNSKTDTRHLLAQIFELCANGPRDFLSICNKMKAHSDELNKSALDNVLDEHSASKLGAINADFHTQYPKISDFVALLFDSTSDDFEDGMISGKDFSVNLATPLSSEETSAFSGLSWYSGMSSTKAIKLLYDTGVVGVVDKNGHREFSDTTSAKTGAQLKRSKLVVHPAYRSALGLT